MSTLEIKLPAIPMGITPEMHQYFMELHRSLGKMVTYSNNINKDISIIQRDIKNGG